MGTSEGRRRDGLRYGLPGMVGGLALAWCLGGLRPLPAQGLPEAATRAEGSGTIALTAHAAGGTWLYLIDTRSQAFAIYKVDDQKGSVKLEAARQYRGDLRLAEYNNLPPEVAAVEAMVSGGAARGPRR